MRSATRFKFELTTGVKILCSGQDTLSMCDPRRRVARYFRLFETNRDFNEGVMEMRGGEHEFLINGPGRYRWGQISTHARSRGRRGGGGDHGDLHFPDIGLSTGGIIIKERWRTQLPGKRHYRPPAVSPLDSPSARPLPISREG